MRYLILILLITGCSVVTVEKSDDKIVMKTPWGRSAKASFPDGSSIETGGVIQIPNIPAIEKD